MRIDELMTPEPAVCTPDTPIQQVAQLMVEHDCGQIPLVRSHADRRLVGVVTDRDIVQRLVARGKNAAELSAESCMTQPVITVPLDADLDECFELMERYRIRRIPVVDAGGVVRGIVSQADIAQHVPQQSTGQLVRNISETSRGGATLHPLRLA